MIFRTQLKPGPKGEKWLQSSSVTEELVVTVILFCATSNLVRLLACVLPISTGFLPYENSIDRH